MFDNVWNAWKSTILWESRLWSSLCKSNLLLSVPNIVKHRLHVCKQVGGEDLPDERQQEPLSMIRSVMHKCLYKSDKVDVKSYFSRPKNAILLSTHFQFHNNDHHRWVCNYRRFKGWWNLMMRFFQYHLYYKVNPRSSTYDAKTKVILI